MSSSTTSSTTSSTSSKQPSEYITTATGSKVHRSAKLARPDLVSIGGRCVLEAGVILGGGNRITLGNLVTVESGSSLVPPPSSSQPQQQQPQQVRYDPLSIGNKTYIGTNVFIESTWIGDNVRIEGAAVTNVASSSSSSSVLPTPTPTSIATTSIATTRLGPRSVVLDNAVVLQGTSIRADAKVPPLAVVSGRDSGIVVGFFE